MQLYLWFGLLASPILIVPAATRRGLNGWPFVAVAVTGHYLLIRDYPITCGPVSEFTYAWGWVTVTYVSMFLIARVSRKRLRRIDIVEQFRDWTPPIKLTPIIEGLLFSIPQKYLAGLGTVVVSNASGLNRKRRREKTRSRGRKLKTSDALGLYHYAYQGEPPWIEVFIDNIFKDEPRIAWWMPFWRDWIISHTLYHELGHHIHAFQSPEFRDKEDVADGWAYELAERQFLRLHPVATVFEPITNRFMKTTRRISKRLPSRREEQQMDERGAPLDLPKCPQCGTPFDPADYRSDVQERLCSKCGAVLPASEFESA